MVCSSRMSFRKYQPVMDGMDTMLSVWHHVQSTGFTGLISYSGTQTKGCIMVLLKLVVRSSACPGFAVVSGTRTRAT